MTNLNNDELNLEEDELSVDEIDFDEVRRVMAEIEANNQARLDAMSPEERAQEEFNQKQMDELTEITDQIQQRRIEREIEFMHLSPEETFMAYKKINENAEKFAEELGMESEKASDLRKKNNK